MQARHPASVRVSFLTQVEGTRQSHLVSLWAWVLSRIQVQGKQEAQSMGPSVAHVPVRPRWQDEGGCPADYPFPSSTHPGTFCYNTAAYAAAGTGPCDSWFKTALSHDGGCPGNPSPVCATGAPTPMTTPPDCSSAQPFSCLQTAQLSGANVRLSPANRNFDDNSVSAMSENLVSPGIQGWSDNPNYYSDGSCTSLAWVQVDLGQQKQIGSINIHHCKREPDEHDGAQAAHEDCPPPFAIPCCATRG